MKQILFQLWSRRKESKKDFNQETLAWKGKIKENNDLDDEDDVVSLPISTTATESTYRYTQHSL